MYRRMCLKVYTCADLRTWFPFLVGPWTAFGLVAERLLRNELEKEERRNWRVRAHIPTVACGFVVIVIVRRRRAKKYWRRKKRRAEGENKTKIQKKAYRHPSTLFLLIAIRPFYALRRHVSIYTYIFIRISVSLSLSLYINLRMEIYTQAYMVYYLCKQSKYEVVTHSPERPFFVEVSQEASDLLYWSSHPPCLSSPYRFNTHRP